MESVLVLLRATAFTPMKIKTLGEMWLTGRKLVGPLVTLENSALEGDMRKLSPTAPQLNFKRVGHW